MHPQAAQPQITLLKIIDQNSHATYKVTGHVYSLYYGDKPLNAGARIVDPSKITKFNPATSKIVKYESTVESDPDLTAARYNTIRCSFEADMDDDGDFDEIDRQIEYLQFCKKYKAVTEEVPESYTPVTAVIHEVQFETGIPELNSMFLLDEDYWSKQRDAIPYRLDTTAFITRKFKEIAVEFFGEATVIETKTGVKFYKLQGEYVFYNNEPFTGVYAQGTLEHCYGQAQMVEKRIRLEVQRIHAKHFPKPIGDATLSEALELLREVVKEFDEVTPMRKTENYYNAARRNLQKLYETLAGSVKPS